MENAIDLKQFLETVKKRLPLIVSVTLLVVLLIGFISYRVLTPTYEATTQLLVNSTDTTEGGFTPEEIDANIQLIGTYNIIIKSPTILSQVIDELGLNETTESLTERITVSNVEGSQVVVINVQDGAIGQAVDIANTTATVFQREIQSLMNVNNVNILSPAKVPADPVPLKPNPVLNMLIGSVIGFLLGIGIAILVEQLNTTVRTEMNVEDLGIPLLGAVSPIQKYKTNDRLRKESVLYAEESAVDPASSSKTDSTY